MALQNNINAPTPFSVSKGGQGNASLTAYAPLFGGITTTDVVQSAASLGTAGTVLTSNGAGALASFQTFYGSPYLSGLYYAASQIGHGLGIFTTSIIGTGFIFYMPFYVARTNVFTDIATYLVVGSAATNINMGVYASGSNGNPTGGPLSGTTSGSIASTGSATTLSYTFSSPITLTGGQVYWLALTCSSAVPTFVNMTSTSSGLGMVNLASTNGGCNYVGCLFEAFVYSATLPTAGTPSGALNTQPLIALVAQ